MIQKREKAGKWIFPESLRRNQPGSSLLVIQQLRLCASKAGGEGSRPDRETDPTCHARWPKSLKKKKKPNAEGTSLANTLILFPGPVGSRGKESACNAGDSRVTGSIPVSRRFPWSRK